MNRVARLKRYHPIFLIGFGIALMFASLSMMYEISFWRTEEWYDFPFHLFTVDKWQAYDFWFLMNLLSLAISTMGGLLFGTRRERQRRERGMAQGAT